MPAPMDRKKADGTITMRQPAPTRELIDRAMVDKTRTEFVLERARGRAGARPTCCSTSGGFTPTRRQARRSHGLWATRPRPWRRCGRCLRARPPGNKRERDA